MRTVSLKKRIKVEQYTGDVRSYSVTTEISNHPQHSFLRPLREESVKYLQDVGDLGTSLLREVFAIDGVCKVFITPYRIEVVKGHAFEWDDIEPDIITALNKCFEGFEESEAAVIKVANPPQ